MHWRLAALPLLLVCRPGWARPSDGTDKNEAARSYSAADAASPANDHTYLLVDAPSAVRQPASAWPASAFVSMPVVSDRASDLPGAEEVLRDPALAMTFGGTGQPTRAERKATRLDEEVERNTGCENHTLPNHLCRVTMARVIGESIEFLLAQHGGNIYMDDDTRNEIEHGKWWTKYTYCVEHYRWSRWKDDDPFGVDYIGHPMMGAMTSSIYEQNDPKQRALRYENSRRYWYGRLRAMAYSAAYSTQWKIGPMSEASIGNTGIGYYVRHRDGIVTNETGMQDFFVTPIGGLAWNVGEDALDRWVVSHIRHAHPRNIPILLLASTITPLKSAANLTRFRAMYYRDYDESTVDNRTR